MTMLHHTTTSPSLFSASILFLFLNKIAKLCLQLLFVCHWDLKNVAHFIEEPNTVLCMLLNSNARVEVLPDRHLCWKETHQQLYILAINNPNSSSEQNFSPIIWKHSRSVLSSSSFLSISSNGINSKKDPCLV